MTKRSSKVLTLLLALFALFAAVVAPTYAQNPPSGGDLPFIQAEGIASAVSDTSVTVEDMVFTIDADTMIFGTLEDGAQVAIFALDLGNGDYLALQILVADGWTPPPASEFSAAGMVTAISAESLTIEDTWMGSGESFTFVLKADTVMPSTPVVGDFAFVDATVADDGTMTATYVEILDDGGHDQYAYYFGTVTALADTSVTIETEGNPMGGGGETVTLALNADTYIDGTLDVGSDVYAEATVGDDGSETATYIAVIDGSGPGNGDYRSVVGVVEAISADSITVSISDSARTSEAFLITTDTFWWTEPQVGDSVMLDAYLNADGVWEVLWIEVLGGGGEPTDFFEVIGEVSELTTDGFIVDGETYVATADTVFEGEVQPEVGDTVYAFGIVADGANVLTYVAVEDGNWGSDYFDLDGTVDAISDTLIVVDGTSIIITVDTTIEGNPQVGDQVYVAGFVGANGDLTADYILNQAVGGGNPSQPWVEAMGVISAYTADTSITLNGVEFAIDADTLIEGAPSVDLTAYVFGVVNDQDTLVAVMILILDEATAEGVIESISPNSVTVAGTTFGITAQTRIVGSVTVGDHVRIGTSAARAAGGNALLIERTTLAPTAIGLDTMTSAAPSILLLTLALAGLVLVTSRIWLRKN